MFTGSEMFNRNANGVLAQADGVEVKRESPSFVVVRVERRTHKP